MRHQLPALQGAVLLVFEACMLAQPPPATQMAAMVCMTRMHVRASAARLVLVAYVPPWRSPLAP